MQSTIGLSTSYFQAILDFVLSSNWTKVALIYDVFTHDTVMLEVR